MLNRTVFFMLWGDNLQGAMQLGVPINRVRIIAFAINGLMAAIAGIVFTSQIGFVPNSTRKWARDESDSRLRIGRN